VKIRSEQAVAEGRHVEVFRLDTGERLRWVRWFDPDTGEACAFKRDPDSPWGRAMLAADVPADAISVVIRAPLRFTERTVARPGVLGGKPEMLPEELTRRSVSYEQYRQARGVDAEECEERACHRPATYLVRHLQDAPPLFLPDGTPYRQTVTVEIHKYCARHYRCPTRFSEHGVESEIEILHSRPQW
jgi:hypothetical protein